MTQEFRGIDRHGKAGGHEGEPRGRISRTDTAAYYRLTGSLNALATKKPPRRSSLLCSASTSFCLKPSLERKSLANPTLTRPVLKRGHPPPAARQVGYGRAFTARS